MHFKLEFRLQGLGLDLTGFEGEQADFLQALEYRQGGGGEVDAKQVDVLLRQPTGQYELEEFPWLYDTSMFGGPVDTFGVSRTKQRVSREVYEYFSYLAETKQLLLADDLETEASYPVKRQRGEWEVVTPYEGLPTAVASACAEAQQSLTIIAEEVTKIIMWRSGVRGHHPIRATTLKWSRKGRDGTWYFAPFFHPEMRYQAAYINNGNAPRQWPTITCSRRAWSDIQSLLCMVQAEPLGHDLCRQAWEQQRLHHSRSALILAISAAQIGIEQAFAALDPQRAREHSSTNYLTLLESDLPKALMDKKRAESLGIESEFVKILRKWNDVRNAVVHGQGKAWGNEYQKINADAERQLRWAGGLEELLDSVAALLWWLDGCCRNLPWARKYANDYLDQLKRKYEPGS